MRTQIFTPLLLLSIASLAACAGSANSKALPSKSSSRSVHQEPAISRLPLPVYVGWISFTAEFRLYPRKEDVGKLYDRTCTSGHFATKRQQVRAARRFEGRRVRITGTLLPVGEYWGPSGFNGLIENYCASPTILIAQTIEELPEGS